MKELNLTLGMYADRLSSRLNYVKSVFEGAEDVWLYDLSKSPSGHGHYKITLHVDFNKIPKVFTVNTSDMQLIDDWNDDDGNITSETIISVLDVFEEQIREYIEEIEN